MGCCASQQKPKGAEENAKGDSSKKCPPIPPGRQASARGSGEVVRLSEGGSHPQRQGSSSDNDNNSNNNNNNNNNNTPANGSSPHTRPERHTKSTTSPTAAPQPRRVGRRGSSSKAPPQREPQSNKTTATTDELLRMAEQAVRGSEEMRDLEEDEVEVPQQH